MQPLVTEDFHPVILSHVTSSTEEKSIGLEKYKGYFINRSDTVSVKAVYYYIKENVAKMDMFIKVLQNRLYGKLYF